ncbi:MAG TPA: amidohydrolase [Syntrophomonadaceae bacterium]|nr:amidohydrolase [Syntrophomonadaceae bacterium]
MIAIQCGTIMTMDTIGNLQGGTILIEGEFIQAVGQDVILPADCQVVDARGLYITPGFIDAHTHLGLEEEIYQVEGDDVNETSEPLTPQLHAVDGVNFQDLAFGDALRGGVTRAMCLPGSANIIGGQGVLLKNLAHRLSDMIYKEPWGLKAALGENPKRVYGRQKKSPITRMANASLLREALYTATRLSEKKEIDPRESFRYQSLLKVIKKEMPLRLHAHRADDILTALRIKDEFDIDMIIEHGTEAPFIAKELVQRQVAVCLGPLLNTRAKVEMKEISFTTAGRLAELGVEFCLITDHPVVPVEHLRVCAALAVRAGLDPEIAMQAITIKPAGMLKVDHELGSITPGKRADLAAFGGHPLDFQARLQWAMVDGLLWRNGHA